MTFYNPKAPRESRITPEMIQKSRMDATQRERADMLLKHGVHVFSPYEAYNGQLSDNARLSTLSVRDVMQSRDGWSQSRHPLNYFKSDDALPPLIMGAAEEIREKFEDDRRRRWSIDVNIVLSPRLRVRGVTILIFTPYAEKIDLNEFANLANFHAMRSVRQTPQSVCVGHHQRIFAEQNRLLGLENTPYLPQVPDPAAWLLRNIEEDGLYRLIRDAADAGYGSAGACSNPLIRIFFYGGLGICFDRQSLDSEWREKLIRQWLHDIVLSSQGEGRWRYYDTRKRAFYTDSSKHLRLREDEIRTLAQAAEAGL
jgi:hypothetical protein